MSTPQTQEADRRSHTIAAAWRKIPLDFAAKCRKIAPIPAAAERGIFGRAMTYG